MGRRRKRRRRVRWAEEGGRWRIGRERRRRKYDGGWEGKGGRRKEDGRLEGRGGGSMIEYGKGEEGGG